MEFEIELNLDLESIGITSSQFLLAKSKLVDRLSCGPIVGYSNLSCVDPTHYIKSFVFDGSRGVCKIGLFIGLNESVENLRKAVVENTVTWRLVVMQIEGSCEIHSIEAVCLIT